MIVSFGKVNGKPVKIDVIDAIFRSGRTIAKPKPRKAVCSLVQFREIMVFIKGVADTLKVSKSPELPTSAAQVEAPAPIAAPEAPVAEVTNSPTEASPSVAEEMAPAAESTCPAPNTEVPAADLDENSAAAPTMAPVGQPMLEWTAEDDAQLLALRDRKIPWKEIGAILGGKHGIRERFNELSQARSTHAGGEDKEAENSRPAIDGVHIDFDTDEGAKPERTSIEGTKRAILHFDEGDDMTLKEVMYLYKLHDLYEEKKWIEISSKFFDKTGKRIDPGKLRDQLGDAVWSVED